MRGVEASRINDAPQNPKRVDDDAKIEEKISLHEKDLIKIFSVHPSCRPSNPLQSSTMPATPSKDQAEVVLVGCGAPLRGMGWYHAVQMLGGECPSAKLCHIVEPWFLGAGASGQSLAIRDISSFAIVHTRNRQSALTQISDALYYNETQGPEGRSSQSSRRSRPRSTGSSSTSPSRRFPRWPTA